MNDIFQVQVSYDISLSVIFQQCLYSKESQVKTVLLVTTSKYREILLKLEESLVKSGDLIIHANEFIIAQ